MIESRDFSFIHRYFISEKQESLLFLFVGIAAMTAAVVFFFFIKGHASFHKGAAIPLFIIGLIQLTVGFTVYARSNKQRLDVAYHIGTESQGYVKNTELPRMQAVMRNFVVYRWVEIALIGAGLAIAFIFRASPDRSFFHGLGIALAIQAAIMLGADYFAEKRGAVYTNELKKIIAV